MPDFFQFSNAIDSTVSLLSQHLDHTSGAEKLAIQITLKGHWNVLGAKKNVVNDSPADGSQLVLSIFDTLGKIIGWEGHRVTEWDYKVK